MADGHIAAYAFPPEITPSEALHAIADELSCPGAMTTEECGAMGRAVRQLAARVARMELSLGLFRGTVVYEAANDGARTLVRHDPDGAA